MFDTIGEEDPIINMLFNRYNYPLTDRKINVCTGRILYTFFRYIKLSLKYIYTNLSLRLHNSSPLFVAYFLIYISHLLSCIEITFWQPGSFTI